ncbi:unnamed protein product [Fusarium equiseti]|uniref:Fungal N-terminal domain-containing protein n=1 Tax=Fusarium equiseti TaxID=61235 RepID=A0A8J2N8U2_FUSEQ|nr:unnamed protein product [Fusarium equiseti]
MNLQKPIQVPKAQQAIKYGTVTYLPKPYVFLMAEAVGAVGAAASFVQLTDVSIRTSLYLYSFFSSLHKAKYEFQRHVTVLRDVHDVIQLIRQITASQSLHPTGEEMLKKQLLTITHELSTLEKVTAGKNPSTLGVQLRWVLKSAETDRTLQELERRKSSMTLLLHTKITYVESTLQDNVADIPTRKSSAQTREHQGSNRTMLESLLSLVKQQNQQGALTISDISARFDGLSIQMDSTVQMYKESLCEGFSPSTRDHEVTFLEGYMDQFLRRALDSYILPHIEEPFSKRSELQNAATLRLIQEAMGQATDEMVGLVTNITKGKEIEQEDIRPTERLETDTNLSDSPLASFSDDHQVTSKVRRSGICRSSGTKEWSYWTSIPSVGTFRVQYRSQLGNTGRFWTIKIDFWPSITSLLSKCISLKYSNNYDQQGYIALFPSLAIYPIISKDHSIWKLIDQGDLAGVRLQLRDHKNGPHDQDPDGVSLLMYASWTGSLDVAQFLLTQGADPTRTNASGLDSLRLLTGSVVNQVIHCRLQSLYGQSDQNDASGADIRYMEWANENWIDYVDEDGVMSPTAYAEAAGFMSIWRHALRKAGYKPDEVFLEDKGRRREFRKSHGTRSSAVEMEDPPRISLRRRLV